MNPTPKQRYQLYRSLLSLLNWAFFFLFAFFIYALFADKINWTDISRPNSSQRNPTKAIAKTLDEKDCIENGIHIASGLRVAEGFELVRATCTGCHSAQLITQNRANREGWQSMIKWMQETQGLWELGPSEEKILNYLATNYAPKAVGRRANLEIVEWYELE